MSRKELEKFDPTKLKPGTTKMIEVVNPQDHYHEVHYFFRDHDGELLSGITHGFRNARDEISNWKKLKLAKPEKLIQLQLPLMQSEEAQP